MNKFTERMFGKNIKAVVNFIDLDQDNAVLSSSDQLEGKVGNKIEFNPTQEIAALLHKGYVLADNGFNPGGDAPDFEKDKSEYQITFHHVKENKAIESKKLQQTIHYQGAASRTPENSITEVNFTHYEVMDLVTGKTVEDKGWLPAKQSFMQIGTPTLPGFIPDQTVVGGETVTASDDNKEYTVNFSINNAPSSLTQTAEIRYVDLNNENKIIEVEKLTGQPNMPIEYDPEKKVDELKQKGFALVHNGFNENGDVQFFGNSDSYEPVFIITMKYTAVAVNAEHPDAHIDPSEYQQKSTFTVKFAGLEQAPKDIVQTAIWNRTVTLLPETNELVSDGYYDTEWQADIDHYQNVKIPVVQGYHTKRAEVTAPELSMEDQVSVVTYHENAAIIPVDEEGKAILGAAHPQILTDKDNPSKAAKDEIIPDVDGYHCDLMTITPEDPGKDLKVSYKSNQKKDTMYITLGDQDQKSGQAEPEKSVVSESAKAEENTATEETQTVADTENTTAAAKGTNTANDASEAKDQVAIINFIDMDHNGVSLTSSGPLVGKPGDSINDLYSTKVPLKVLEKAGYHVIFNNFDSDGFVQRFDNNNLMTQVFTIGVSKKVTTDRLEDLVVQKRMPDISELKKTKYQLEKIKPELLPQGSNDASSQTVSRLLDVVTALLNLIFVLGNKDQNNKE